jgi:hypothetical protein
VIVNRIFRRHKYLPDKQEKAMESKRSCFSSHPLGLGYSHNQTKAPP